MMKRRLTASVLGVGLLAGCVFTTPIQKILDDPRKYDDQKVTISGEVTDSSNLVFIKFYHVDDGTGKIAVVASGAVPRRGARVKVRGTVRQAFAIGSQSLTVIVEDPPER